MFSQCCSARNLNKYKHKSLIVDDISRSRRSDGNFLGFARLRVRGFSGEGEKKMVEILFISSFDLYSILDEYYILYPWKDLLNFVQIFFFFFLNNPPLFFSFLFLCSTKFCRKSVAWKTFHSSFCSLAFVFRSKMDV